MYRSSRIKNIPNPLNTYLRDLLFNFIMMKKYMEMAGKQNARHKGQGNEGNQLIRHHRQRSVIFLTENLNTSKNAEVLKHNAKIQ